MRASSFKPVINGRTPLTSSLNSLFKESDTLEKGSLHTSHEEKKGHLYSKTNLTQIDLLPKVEFLPNIDLLPKSVMTLQSEQIIKSDNIMKSDNLSKGDQFPRFEMFDKPLSFRNDALDNAYLKEINALVENLERTSRGVYYCVLRVFVCMSVCVVCVCLFV